MSAPKEVVLYDANGDVIQLADSSITNPQRWLVEIFGGGENSTGITVTTDVALGVSALWKACMLICTAVAKCPTKVFSVDGHTRTENRAHPAYSLVRYKPNNFQRAYDFKQYMTLMLLLHGECFAKIEWDGRGRPYAIVPLRNQDVRVITTPRGFVYEATIFYDNGATIMQTLDASEMLHITWLSPDGVRGTGMLHAARETLGQLVSMQRFAGGFFRNNARPDFWIKHPIKFNNLAAKKAFRDDWQEYYGGGKGMGKIAVLDEGMTIETFGTSQTNAQFIETYKQCIVEVSNFTGLPASKLGDTSRNAYNSLEQDALAALADCYEGFIVNWEEALNEKLLSAADQRTGANEFRFERDSLLAVDLKTKAEYMARALGNNTAWVTQDEARAFFDMNPLGGTAAELPAPAALTAQQAAEQNAQNDAQDPPAPPGTPVDDAEDSTDTAMSAVVGDAIRRASTRISKGIMRAHGKGGIAAAYEELAREGSEAAEVLSASATALAAIYGGEVDAIQRRMLSSLHGAFALAISESPKEPESFQKAFTAVSARLSDEVLQHVKDELFRRAA